MTARSKTGSPPPNEPALHQLPGCCHQLAWHDHQTTTISRQRTHRRSPPTDHSHPSRRASLRLFPRHLPNRNSGFTPSALGDRERCRSAEVERAALKVRRVDSPPHRGAEKYAAGVVRRLVAGQPAQAAERPAAPGYECPELDPLTSPSAATPTRLGSVPLATMPQNAPTVSPATTPPRRRRQGASCAPAVPSWTAAKMSRRPRWRWPRCIWGPCSPARGPGQRDGGLRRLRGAGRRVRAHFQPVQVGIGARRRAIDERDKAVAHE